MRDIVKKTEDKKILQKTYKTEEKIITKKYDIENLTPSGIWRHFAAICAVPHISGEESELSKKIEKFCLSARIVCSRDAAGNLLLEKGASSADVADAPKIIFQAHLDMVPQANADIDHDFSIDPIIPIVDGDWVRASGTTLGADNGIGVAAILALMQSDDIKHGPLGAILTVAEETGLNGANALNPKFVEGNILINLDSEEFGILYVGCAGGCETSYVFEAPTEAIQPDETLFRVISVSGLEGGHSGVDIHLGRMNAIIVLFSILAKLSNDIKIWMADSQGGSVSNAIPRDASAKIAVRGIGSDELTSAVANFQDKMRESSPNDPGLCVDCAPTQPFTNAIPPSETAKIATAIANCPNGVKHMSAELEGVVETSSNIGKVGNDGSTLTLITMQRSLVESEMSNIRSKLNRHFETAGFETIPGDSFPPWKPSGDSRILGICVESQKRLFGTKPKALAIHAGLECGVIGRLNPDLDMISFGPTITSPHSPNEKVNIASVADFWRLLVEVLEQASSS